MHIAYGHDHLGNMTLWEIPELTDTMIFVKTFGEAVAQYGYKFDYQIVNDGFIIYPFED